VSAGGRAGGAVLRERALYRVPEAGAGSPADPLPRVSLLIPARNESAAIAACVEAGLQSRGVDLEVVVLDDGSEDDTREIVARIAAMDPRVRLKLAPPLPAGWCGKQHACHTLAALARNPVLAFVDADVRWSPMGWRGRRGSCVPPARRW
jgi:glycosyltransferase involved in cell wall biosynthesis